MSNIKLLKILFIEDLPSDVDLAVLELRKEKLIFEHITVCTKDDLISALTEFKPDLIISDYMMPAFNGLQALLVVKELQPEIPFILFTGSVNEETAVACIKAGALDYVIKEHMTRLPYAVKEALEQVIIRKEKRASEILLRESEEKLQSIFTATPVGIGLVVNRVLMEVNDTFCQIVGYNRRELIGKSSEMLYPSRVEYEFVGKEKYQQIAEKGTGTVETIFKHKDGKILNVILGSTPLDKNDQSKGVTFTVLDITERKKAEEALRESEERFRALYNDAVVGLYRTNAKGEILLANKTLIKILGFNTFEELSGINLNQSGIGTTKQRKKFIELIEKEGVIKDLEAVWVCRDGKEIYVRENARLIRDSDGKILYYDGTVEDITEKKKAEKDLKSSLSILNASLESTADGILIVDGQGIIIKWNHKFAEMWGIPDSILDMHDDNAAINQILDKLSDPDKFISIVNDLYLNSDKSSFDKLEFKDGRIFERFSQPQRIDDKVVGRVWSFRDITESHNAELSLKLSEEKFRSIAENLSDIIFITDKEGIIKYISPSCKIFGYPREEFINKFFGEFLAEGELAKGKQLFSNALNALNLSSIVTLVFKRKDGSNFFAELSGSKFNIDNEEVGVLGLIRDVSDKIQKETELRKLSQAVEQNPASIIITNTAGDIEYVNPKLCEITGYSKEELVGANPHIFSSGEKSGDEYKSFWNTIKAGNDWKGEFHNKKKNGELFWESATVSPIKNEKDEITHFLGIKEDITEKKIMEAAVVANEQRYRELFLNNPVPTYIFDENTLEFLEVNDVAAQNYGYSREEFASMTLKDIRQQGDVADLLESVKELGKEVFYSMTIRHRKKDGTVFPVEITSHSLPEKNGRKTRLVIAIDITERLVASEQMKLAKEKAEASDKLKTTFLNNISHEVRTPLNGILGFAEIMSQQNLSGDDLTVSLSMLHESSDRLLDTITNYMDISLLTSGNLTILRKDFFPVQILRKLFGRYDTVCSNRKLKLSLEIPVNADEIQLNSDQEIFRKIVCHLLNNAIKFTEKGSINYGFVHNENELEFFVKDTGIGIGKESIESIFEHFVKEDRGPSKLSEGSGLGLSIAKGMIEMIGGTMRVESELESGSGFFFAIPLSEEKKISSSRTPAREYKKSIGTDSILVAEDDETNFFYLKTILTRETKSVILHASNGREAVDLFRASRSIKLILMDIKMPEMDGLEATRQIKSLDPNVPIIAITAYAMSGDEEKVLVAGCDGYLSKPISKGTLLKKMEEFIKI